MKRDFAAPMLVLFLLALACASGEQGDPLTVNGPATDLGGSLSSGGNLANAPISEANQYDFCENLYQQLYRSFLSTFQVAGETDLYQTIRITGNTKGHAIVKTQPLKIISPVGAVNRDAEFFDTTAFYDYSNDGRLFMGGLLEFQGWWREIDGNYLPITLGISGKLKCAGIYQAEMHLSCEILFDSTGAMRPVGVPMTGIPAGGMVRIWYDDDSIFDINPYPFLPGPG